MDLKIIAALVGIGIAGTAGYFIGKSRCGHQGKKHHGMHHPGMHSMGPMMHGGGMGHHPGGHMQTAEWKDY